MHIPEDYKLMFSSLDCSDNSYHFRVFDWQSNDNLPPCGLGLNYPDFENINWEKLNPECFRLVTIDIKEVLDRFKPYDGVEGYLLSPWKYYRIRKELSLNSPQRVFYYPEVSIENGKYHLGQGRHRLNALMKIYGIEKILVKVSLID